MYVNKLTHILSSVNSRLPVLLPFVSGRQITSEAMKMNASLENVDPEMHKIIELEKKRQKESVCLIPSENYAPKYVLDALGTVMTNKYSEGYCGQRYYGGNQIIDMSEALCIKRALQAFRLEPSQWGVNVQALSGSPANMAVYTGLLDTHDRIMALDLTHGGHLSHGFQTPTKKVSAVSKYFESYSYRLDTKTGLIDYDQLQADVLRYRPKLIIAGTSAYARLLDYERFRRIADSCGAILMADMAHISGLVAANVLNNPFEYSDIVTTTSHKSLRGPRGALIFYRKGQRTVDKNGQPIMYDYETKINSAVFPGLQGGPHNHTIAALAVALKEAQTPEFVEYQKQVLKNCKVMAQRLVDKHGFQLVSGGTDTHLILADLRNKGLSGAKTERLGEVCSLIMNKNTVPEDKSAMNPSGIRLGSPAMTTRGLVEKDFETIADFIDQVVKLGVKIQTKTGPKLADFVQYLNDPPPEVTQLSTDVKSFASSFPTIGF